MAESADQLAARLGTRLGALGAAGRAGDTAGCFTLHPCRNRPAHAAPRARGSALTAARFPVAEPIPGIRG